MPVLENPAYERFAQEIFKGAKVPDAYVAAGFQPNSGNAHRLNGRECIRKRIAELQTLSAARLVKEAVNKDYVLRQSVKLHEACMDEGRWNPNAAARALEMVGRHVDVQAFKDTSDVNVHITIDAAISKLEAVEVIEGDYERVDE